MTQYGAACNGTTNDATAINNALTAANTAGGGTVYIPDGKVCAISSTLTMSGSNVTLMSHGNGTLKKTANIQAISITGTDNTVSGLRINGNSSGGSGVYVYGSRNTVKDNWVHNNTAHGIGLDGQTSTCANNLVTNNRVVSNGGVGIAINKCTHNRIIGNRASSNTLEGITVDNLAHYTVVADNEIDGNASGGGVGGIGLDYVKYVTISGNVIKNTVTNVPGIRTQNNLGISSNISIVGNTLYNNPWGCIDLQTGTGSKHTDYTTVTGNSCDSLGTALHVGVGGIGNALIGNTLNGGTIIDNGTSTRNLGN
jgi:parallel beta-helix repeat protein